jgi:hypothetical protein
MTATNHRITDILIHTVVTFLTPMFLPTFGDLDQAHTAALETVRACLTRNPMDLFLIGQMIAFGLATLSSVSLSMTEDIPINLVLRLRANAVSLHRASDRCRRALPEPNPQDAPLSDIDLEEEQRIIAEVARTQKRVAEYQASFAQPQAAPPPSAPSAPKAITKEFDPNFSQNAPESLDVMKAAMARIVAEAERRIGEAEATAPAIRQAEPHGAPLNAEKILRAAWSCAMPDAPLEVIDELVNPPPV